eukprot:3050756-Prymnesium_polylepis.1
MSELQHENCHVLWAMVPFSELSDTPRTAQARLLVSPLNNAYLVLEAPPSARSARYRHTAHHVPHPN